MASAETHPQSQPSVTNASSSLNDVIVAAKGASGANTAEAAPTSAAVPKKKKGRSIKHTPGKSNRQTAPRGAEDTGKRCHSVLKTHITQQKGRFLRDDDGSLHLLINGRKIAIDLDSNTRL